VIAYLDASALVKLFLDEDDADLARGVWESELPVATARVSQAELACALEAAVRNRRLGRGRVEQGIHDGTFLWNRADAIEANAKPTPAPVDFLTSFSLARKTSATPSARASLISLTS